MFVMGWMWMHLKPKAGKWQGRKTLISTQWKFERSILTIYLKRLLILEQEMLFVEFSQVTFYKWTVCLWQAIQWLQKKMMKNVSLTCSVDNGMKRKNKDVYLVLAILIWLTDFQWQDTKRPHIHLNLLSFFIWFGLAQDCICISSLLAH